MVLQFNGSSYGLNVVASEVALELADAAYRPLVAEHVPGVANTLADALSCVSDPAKIRQLPAQLQGGVRALVPERPREQISPSRGTGRSAHRLQPASSRGGNES